MAAGVPLHRPRVLMCAWSCSVTPGPYKLCVRWSTASVAQYSTVVDDAGVNNMDIFIGLWSPLSAANLPTLDVPHAAHFIRRPQSTFTRCRWPSSRPLTRRFVLRLPQSELASI